MPSQDTSGAAEAIVVSASAICEDADSLWRVIKHVSIPAELLADTREEWKVTHETEPMARTFLYKEVRDLTQAELADRLAQRPALLKGMGLTSPPEQQTISEIWQAFDSATQRVIETAATGIAQEASDHDIIPDTLVPCDPEKEVDEDEDEAEYTKRKATGTIKLARKHAFPEFESGRALNRSYEDEAILDMVARICSHKGSANAEGEYGWLTDDDLTASGDTILRVLKQFATADGDDAQLSLDAALDDDRLPDIDQMRDALMDSFDNATENIINSIRGSDPFDDRQTIAAIDITYERIWTSPWDDYENRIPNPDFPRMASGYRKDNETRYGFKYATLTLVGDMAPIVLAVEPVKENSNWEDDDTTSFSRAALVERLLAKASQYVDLDMIVFDRGFDSDAVYHAVADRGLTFLSPIRRYADELEDIEDIKTTEGVDAGVVHDVPYYVDGEVHHTAEIIYAPVDGDEADDPDANYGAFRTNVDHVAPEEIEAVVNLYSRRWDIENQYKSITAMLPRTSSMDYRVRFTNFVLTTLLYNLWRLTDYLIKVGKGVEIRADPEVSFRTFIRALTEYLREID